MNRNRTSPASFERFAPFLSWIGEVRNLAVLRADAVAGITVALVLVPQSMAYAQLAGLPAYYGLYAAFLPPMVASLFGSSRQLATGPVAVVSLLSAASLQPLAAAGSEGFIAYSILLALMVGLIQFSLGLLRLGVVVNFLSHPVVMGFTNAAAIIIATSQLGKIFGVAMEKQPHHYQTVWNTIVAAAGGTHLPTLLFALAALTIIYGLKRYLPKVPAVLAAVAITTMASYWIEFHKEITIHAGQLQAEDARTLIERQSGFEREMARMKGLTEELGHRYQEHLLSSGEADPAMLLLAHQISQQRMAIAQHAREVEREWKQLKSMVWLEERDPRTGAATGKFHAGHGTFAGISASGDRWRIVSLLDEDRLLLSAGGAVVGSIPAGLPAFKLPELDFSVIISLLASALTISLIGFMEAISIAKAMAAKTQQRLDVNQELIGQGLSNIAGSFFQSYAVSGSFSRSAVNIDAGARTGFSAVVTSLMVIVTLIWLTPLLYHLPQATLAAVIMSAVIGLFDFKSLRHVWHVQKQDGVIAAITFVLTLAFAPHLEMSIIIGVLLSLGVYLYQSMKPRVARLSRHPDGSLRDAIANGLPVCPNITVIRFDGSLYFANTSYFEDKVQEASSEKPDQKYLIIDAEGINHIDASGEEMLSKVTEQLRENGVRVLLTRMKKQAFDLLKHSGYIDRIGENSLFRRTEQAIQYVWDQLEADGHDRRQCPLAAKSAGPATPAP